MNKIDEKELHNIFQGIKNKDKDSFTALYEQYYQLVYRIIFSILKNRENSEDIAQVVFSKIYQLPKEKLPENYEASWLYKVSKNETLQYIRKLKNETTIEDIYEFSVEDNNIDEIIDIETYKKMIEGLDEKEKEIISLKVLSQFTFKKIGQMLQMPTGTVQWSYYKAVNSLRISLSSLAGFIIAFILGIKTTTKNKQNYSEDKNEIIKDYEVNDMESEETKTDTSITEGILGDLEMESTSNEYTSTNTIQKVEEKTEKNNVNIGFFVISIIFFTIFIIFFKKYQQKRKVKTSKG